MGGALCCLCCALARLLSERCRVLCACHRQLLGAARNLCGEELAEEGVSGVSERCGRRASSENAQSFACPSAEAPSTRWRPTQAQAHAYQCQSVAEEDVHFRRARGAGRAAARALRLNSQAAREAVVVHGVAAGQRARVRLRVAAGVSAAEAPRVNNALRGAPRRSGTRRTRTACAARRTPLLLLPQQSPGAPEGLKCAETVE